MPFITSIALKAIPRSIFGVLCLILISAAAPDNKPSSSNTAQKKSASQTPSEAAKKAADLKGWIKQQKKVGGELYEEYATAMHTKRLRNEFTAAQWKTILLQKRIRVPFTARDHHDIELFFIGE